MKDLSANTYSPSQVKLAKLPLLLSTIILSCSLPFSASAGSQMVRDANLPTDVQPKCTADISPWFINGHVMPNGWVEPANSLDPIFANFADNTRCDFYKWGSQMFLWLASGDQRQHVFNRSPTFYDVSIKVNGKREYISSTGPMRVGVRKGKVDQEIEMGQAGNNDVLISQAGSLVYYSIHANDVFATYTTGLSKNAFTKDGALNTEFPNTAQQLQQVANFAARYGYPLGYDKKALAMELKISWVDAATVADPSQYILTQAIVPKFDRSKPNGPWPEIGEQTKTLAMVGMHVVGTVNSHPEMVWSTFEHVTNVPDNTYKYTNQSGGVVTSDYNSNTDHWTFLPKGNALPKVITAHGQYNTSSSGNSITSVNGSRKIEATDQLRVDPWGNLASDQTSERISNNTDLVSLNVSVLSQLMPGDVRGNYIQTGGIWTAQGQIPSSGSDTNLRGSLNLANTTMETFYQSPSSGFKPINCFGCHGLSSASPAYKVSHISADMQPLPQR